MPRQPTCECGECRKCKNRIYMRRWYARKSVEERQAYVARRDIELVKAADRARYEKSKNEPEYRAKRAARTALNNAVRDGHVTRGECEATGDGCRGRIEAHHHDYSRPLDVRWLCKGHHDMEHVYA